MVFQTWHHRTSCCLSPRLLRPCRTTFLSFFQVYKHTEFFPLLEPLHRLVPWLSKHYNTTQLVASFHPLGILREAFPSTLWKAASFPYSVSQSIEPFIALTETWNRFTCFVLCPPLRMYDRWGQGFSYLVLQLKSQDLAQSLAYCRSGINNVWMNEE